MSPKKFSPKEFSPQKFSPKKIFTKKVFTLKISTQKIQYNFHLKYSIVRLSFVDLRWAQLYVSLVVFLFGISDQQQDLTQEPETGTWIHYSKMKHEDRNKLANLKFFELEKSYLKMTKLPLNTMKLQPQPLRPIPFKPPKKLQQLEPPFTQEELPMGILTDLSLTILSLRFIEL